LVGETPAGTCHPAHVGTAGLLPVYLSVRRDFRPRSRPLWVRWLKKSSARFSSCGFYPMSISGNPPGAVGAQEYLRIETQAAYVMSMARLPFGSVA